MFTTNKVSKSLLDAVSTITEDKKRMLTDDDLDETGFHKAAHAAKKANQKHFEFMGKKYPVTAKSHKEEYELAKEGNCVTPMKAKDIAKKEVGKHEKGMHGKNGEVAQHVKKMHKEETVDEGLKDTLKSAGKKVLSKLGHGDDEAMRKDLQKKMGMPQTGKKPESPMASHKEETEVAPLNFKERLLEREMTKKEKAKRHEISGAMEKDPSYFKKKYGANWKNVMYATATKKAMGEELEQVTEAETKDVATDMLSGREQGEGKTNSFRNFKVKIEGSQKTAREPEVEKAPDSKAKESIKAHGGGVNPIEQPKIGVDGHGNVEFTKQGFAEEVEYLDEANITHAAHFDDPKTGKWASMALLTAKNDAEAMEQAKDLLRTHAYRHYKLSAVEKHEPIKMKMKMKEEVENVEEGWDDMMKDVKSKSAPQPNGGAGKKQGSRYGGSKQKDKPEHDDKPMKEGKDPEMDSGAGSAPNFATPANTTSSPVMKRVKEITKSAMGRVKNEMLGKASGNQ